MSKLTIRNGNIVFLHGVRAGDIRVEEGMISEIGADGCSESEIDATGCYVLPGLVDIHTHGIGYESSSSESLEEYAKIEAYGTPQQCQARLHRKLERV